MQPPAFAENTASARRHPNPQKLDGLLGALNRLKSDISCVEARHPNFGSELSSLCDTVINDLNGLNSRNGEDRQADRNNLNLMADEPAEAGEPLPPPDQKANALAAAIDKAGSHLITGLDKTGDGIIFILGKLFTNRAAKADCGTPAEAD